MGAGIIVLVGSCMEVGASLGKASSVSVSVNIGVLLEMGVEIGPAVGAEVGPSSAHPTPSIIGSAIVRKTP